MNLFPNTPKMSHLLLQLFPQHPLLQRREDYMQSISKLRTRARPSASASLTPSDLRNKSPMSFQEKHYKPEPDPVRNVEKPKPLRRSKTSVDTKRRQNKHESQRNNQLQLRPTTHPKPVLTVSNRCWTPPPIRPRDPRFEQEPAEQKLGPKGTGNKRPSKRKSQATYKANQQDFLNRNFQISTWDHLRPAASANPRFGPTPLEKLKFAERKLAMSLSDSAPPRTLDKALQHGTSVKYSNAASTSDDLESGPSSPQASARALSPVQSAARWKKANVYIGSYIDSDENITT